MTKRLRLLGERSQTVHVQPAVVTPTVAQERAGDRSRIGALDSLRGLAALIVCLRHWLLLDGWRDAVSLPERALRGLSYRLLDGGAAVDFFFLLSGFVLALPYVGKHDVDPESGKPAHHRPMRFDVFLLRRVVRIMPTYWLALAVACVLRALCAPHVSHVSAIEKPWLAPITGQDVLQHVLLIFERRADVINGPIWSLAVEMQLALVLPLVIAAIADRPTVLASLVVLLGSVALAHIVGVGGGFLFLPIFVLGCLLAHYRVPIRLYLAGRPAGSRLTLWAVAVGLIWNRALHAYWEFPDVRQEYMSGLGGGLLIALVLSGRRPPALLETRVARFLGAISYSLYLMHLPLLVAAAVALRSLGAPNVLVVCASLALAVLGSTLLHFVAERPSIALGRRLPR